MRRQIPYGQIPYGQIPGLATAGLVAVAAQFLSDHYGAPAMLMAVLLGLAFNFMGDTPRTAPGIETASRWFLRAGVALLGLRINATMIADLGPGAVGLVLATVGAGIGFGLLAAPLFGRSRQFGLLTGGAVAICGASAAMAIAAILPRRDDHARDLSFTVLGVTVASTLAMILYPVLAARLDLDDRAAGLFLGGTIHDVAQVVGAGFSVSDRAGEIATLVKLIRVAMLAPVVLIAALVLRGQADAGDVRPPLLPGFVVGFLVLAGLGLAGVVPAPAARLAADLARWLLLAAVAAVAMKTSLPALARMGGPAIGLLVAETLFLAGCMLTAILLFYR